MDITQNNYEIMKRNLYNKVEHLVKIIKAKTKTALEHNEKEKILRIISFIIISLQVDNLYSSVIPKSGIVSILKIFGLDEKKAEKIKGLCNNGVSVALLSILILKNLRQ